MGLHADTCSSLADLYRERAAVRAADIRNRATLFQRLNDGSRNITTIRAEVDAQAADYTCDLIQLDGDIDAHLTVLRAIEWARGEQARGGVSGSEAP